MILMQPAGTQAAACSPGLVVESFKRFTVHMGSSLNFWIPSIVRHPHKKYPKGDLNLEIRPHVKGDCWATGVSEHRALQSPSLSLI